MASEGFPGLNGAQIRVLYQPGAARQGWCWLRKVANKGMGCLGSACGKLLTWELLGCKQRESVRFFQSKGVAVRDEVSLCWGMLSGVRCALLRCHLCACSCPPVTVLAPNLLSSGTAHPGGCGFGPGPSSLSPNPRLRRLGCGMEGRSGLLSIYPN